MKTYYENQLVKLYCGDSLQLINKLQYNFDAIITDPPYAINFQNNKWDEQTFDITAYYNAFNQVLKSTGSILMFQGWSNVVNTINALKIANFNLKNWIIYDRTKGRGAKTNFVSTREDLLWIVKDNFNYTFNNQHSTIKKKTGGSIGKKNGCQFRKLTNVWIDISPIVPWSKERVNHPTQKPIQLLNRIVRIFSNQYDLILDPFAGSGTTGIACYNLNRKCILIQKEEKYCEIIKNRFQNLIEQKNQELL